MATDKMLARKDGPIGSMIFNNPERHNATSLEMWEAANEILKGFAQDPTIRVVVLSGTGGKAFVSGADISKFEDERATEEAVKHYNKTSDRMSTTLSTMPKPTIAMIQGWCIGGGVSVATTCDLRDCTEDSKFGVPAAKLGLGYGIKGIRRLADLVGPSAAKEIFFTARHYTAQEALRMGLVNQVVPASELQSFVKQYAETIAGNAPLTVNSVKRIVGELLKDPVDRDLALCDRLVAECFANQAVRSCQLPVAALGDQAVTTLEGLGTTDKPHRLQKAFIAEQAAQCGYCIAGMIMGAKALLDQNPDPDEAAIRAALAGNLCRCGTHGRIIRAIRRAAKEA